MNAAFEKACCGNLSSDVLSASATLSQPKFLCFWNDDVTDLAWPASNMLLDSGGTSTAGRGFTTKVSGGLPHHARSIFINLSWVDQEVSRSKAQRQRFEEGGRRP